MRVDFYDDDQVYLESKIVSQGDVVLLAFGGDGFDMFEASEIVEVKQGPYRGDEDKTRFEGVDAAHENHEVRSRPRTRRAAGGCFRSRSGVSALRNDDWYGCVPMVRNRT